MKKLLFVLAFTLMYMQSFSQISATTKDGKSVLLKSDGTWEFVTKKTNIDSNDFGMWKINYFVDDFGYPTSEGYISSKTRINGKFSNSATTNAKLQVGFIISEGNVSLRLYEYASNHSVSGKIMKKSYKIQIKHNEKTVKGGRKSNKDFKAYNYSDRMKVNYSDELLNLFSQGGEFKFYIIETGDYANGSYSFKIDDAAGFANAYRELTKQ